MNKMDTETPTPVLTTFEIVEADAEPKRSRIERQTTDDSVSAIERAEDFGPGSKVYRRERNGIDLVTEVSVDEARARRTATALKIVEAVIADIARMTNIDLWGEDVVNLQYDLTTIMLLRCLYRSTTIDAAQHARTSLTFRRIVELLQIAGPAPGEAATLLKAIEKIVDPPLHKLSDKKKKGPMVPLLEDLNSGYNSSPELVRGYAIRWLMYELSFIVTPICRCSRSPPLEDTPSSDNNTPSSMAKHTISYLASIKFWCHCDMLKPDSYIKVDENPTERRELFDEVQDLFKTASSGEFRQLTLIHLAKQLDLQRRNNSSRDATIEMRQVERDLDELEKFEKKSPTIIDRAVAITLRNGVALHYRFP